MTVPILINLAILFASAGPTPTEAISRPYTVLNQRSNFVEAESRAVTALDVRGQWQETQSRAATVLNQRSMPVDAIARAATVLNTRDQPAVEANSRAVSVCDVGDLNLDGRVDLGDIAMFVDALLNPNANLNEIWASDLNCDLVTDGLDIQAFIEALVH